MFYIGKTLDTFCAALDQLMEYEKLPKISSVDCVSLRAFGFCADGGAEEWFRPLIDTESALRKLGEAAEVPFLASDWKGIRQDGAAGNFRLWTGEIRDRSAGGKRPLLQRRRKVFVCAAVGKGI